jgi:uncharacterized repeat protein (TIGR03803 family)
MNITQRNSLGRIGSLLSALQVVVSRISPRPFAWLGLAAIGFAGSRTSGVVFTELYSFPSTYTTRSGLVQASDGNFYGTTYYGGDHGLGSVFRLTPAGILTTLVSFNNTNGANPQAELIQAADGNLYGVTDGGGTNDIALGGDGTIFRISTNGTLQSLFSFNSTNGSVPIDALIQGRDGSLYGTTAYGGTNGGYGTIFKITTAGVLTSLSSLNSSNGYPAGALVQGTDGNFYGVTGSGTNGYGSIYRVAGNGVVNTLFSFNNTNGAYPHGPLAKGADGNLYGETGYGGTNDLADGGGGGTLFRLSTNGVLTTLVEFNLTNGALPLGGLALGADGNFYGSTAGGTNNEGSYFKLTPNGNLTTLFWYDASTTNGTPQGILARGSDNNFYGTSPFAGAFKYGYAFQLTTNGNFAILGAFRDPNGSMPTSALLRASDRNFYGTTSGGGTNGYGTIFRMTPAGMVTILHSFDSTVGLYPPIGLIEGSDGDLYGTMLEGPGGNGAVFRITTDGIYSIVSSFDGFTVAPPMSGVVQGADGNYYGSTADSVFQMKPDGTLTNFAYFGYFTGFSGIIVAPQNGLVFGKDGNLYGTTSSGGASNLGTIFTVSTHGDFTLLASFNGTNGSNPLGPLIQAADGNFYGTASQGGDYGYGTVFRVTSGGSLSSLASFNYTNGAYPQAGVVQGIDGALYGVTYDGGSNVFGFPFGPPFYSPLPGTVFRVTTSGLLSTLVLFDTSNGSNPEGTLLAAADGSLYGTTAISGSAGGGNIFRLNLASAIQNAARVGNSFVLNLSTIPGQTYQVQYKQSLGQGNWIPLGGNITASNLSTTIADPVGQNSQRLYRVVQLP